MPPITNFTAIEFRRYLLIFMPFRFRPTGKFLRPVIISYMVCNFYNVILNSDIEQHSLNPLFIFIIFNYI